MTFTLQVRSRDIPPPSPRGTISLIVLALLVPAVVLFVLSVASKGAALSLLTQNPFIPIAYVLGLLLVLILRTSNNQPQQQGKEELTFGLQTVQGNFLPYNQPFHWLEIESVLLRNELLTINFRNGRLLQLPVEQPDFAPEAFEAFCHQRIESFRTGLY